MKKNVILLPLFLCSSAIFGQGKQMKFSLTPEISWSHEQLNWSIAGDEHGKNPNILSELKWKNLQGPQIGISSSKKIVRRVHLEAAFRYQWITTGTVNDADYASDNRAAKTSDLNLNANKGHTVQAKAELYYILLSTRRFSILPHTGLFLKHQTVYMLDGEVPLIDGKELKSTYKPKWQGLSLGVRTSYYADQWEITLDVNGHYFPRYSARANWNLQENFSHPTSFIHKARGMGWVTGLYVSRPMSQKVMPFLRVWYSGLSTGSGKDYLYKADGTMSTSHLNGVRSESFSVGIGARIVL